MAPYIPSSGAWQPGRASWTSACRQGAGGPLPVIASRTGCLLDALSHANVLLGFSPATGGDTLFRDPVMAQSLTCRA